MTYLCALVVGLAAVWIALECICLILWLVLKYYELHTWLKNRKAARLRRENADLLRELQWLLR